MADLNCNNPCIINNYCLYHIQYILKYHDLFTLYIQTHFFNAEKTILNTYDCNTYILKCICNNNVNDDIINYIQCESCLAWSHIDHIYTKEQYQTIKQVKDFKYFCYQCIRKEMK